MKKLIGQFKAFYNKKDLDYSTRSITPKEFHTTFFFFLKAFRVLDDERIPKWTYFTPMYISFCGVVALLICLLSTFNGIYQFEIPNITESGTYAIIMIHKLMILSCTVTDIPSYHTLIQALRDDFKYICTDGRKYRERYFKSHVITWQACLCLMLFTIGIAVTMIICANVSLIYLTLTKKVDKTNRMSLPFRFWMFSVNFDDSPYYELAFIFSNMCVMSECYTYMFMMQTQIVWVCQITSKADVIIWSIEDLLIDIRPAINEQEKKSFSWLIKHRMKDIVKKHQDMFRLMDEYANVYQKLLMFEQKLCGPLVCLTAYCAAEKLDVGEIHVILILLCVSIIVLVFIPSYLCTFLKDKVQSTFDACWNIPFWNATPAIRPYLVLIMQRSMRQLPIHAPGFEEVSIETFSKNMTSAYSWFNMLRTANI